jgi:broad specificity phosphatase PhoE
LVIITHGGVIRALMPYLLGVPKEESFKYDPPNASITIFEIINEKKFIFIK